MVSYLAVLITFVFMCPSTSATNIINKHRGFLRHPHYAAYSHEARQKRSAYAGAAALRVLIKAQQIFTDGYNKVFVKPGGQKKCYQDFYSLSPENVKHVDKHKTIGRIGNMGMTIEDKGDSTVLILSEIRGAIYDNVPPVEYIVIYK